MKKKIILIVLTVLLCCGCETKYVLEIDENLKVKETADAIEYSEFYDEYQNSSVERVIGFILEPHLDYFNSNGFEISNIYNDESAGARIHNEYESIEEYVQTSELYKQYGEIDYTEDNNKITLKINGLLSNFEQDQSGKYLIDTSEISIKLPHKVREHNADKVDKENGVYTWYIKEPGVEKELYITFDKRVPKQIPIEFIVAGVMLVVVLVVAYLLWSKLSGEKNKRNEI